MFYQTKGDVLVRLDVAQNTSRIYALSAPLALPPLARGERLYVATKDGRVSRFDLRTGKLEWQRRFRSYGVKKLRLSQGLLFLVTSTGQVRALQEKDGSAKWVRNLRDVSDLMILQMDGIAVSEGLASTEPTLWVAGKHSVEGFAVMSGESRGSFRAPIAALKIASAQDVNAVVGPLVIQDRQLAFVRYDGMAFKFSLRQMNQVLWQKKWPTFFATAAFHGSTLYLGTLFGDVMAVDVHSGREIFSRLVFTRPVSSITYLGEGRLVAVSTEGDLQVMSVRGELFSQEKLHASVYAPPLWNHAQSLLHIVSGYGNMYVYSLVSSARAPLFSRKVPD